MNYFTYFQSDISEIELPSQFNYPFNYQPHEISVIAAKELQIYIQENIEKLHLFDEIGKMFGVLIVENQEGELGYLSAFSGKLGGKNDYEHFVPPVYDMLTSQGFYREEEQKIMSKTREIEALEMDWELVQLKEKWELDLKQSITEIEALKLHKKQAKSIRESKRKEIENWEELMKTEMLKQLDRESSQLHYQLKELIKNWKNHLTNIQLDIDTKNEYIAKKKQERRQMSIALQHRLFESYTFLNAKKEYKSLREIFTITEDELPPSGSGECAAPKLLHFAYLNHLKPIALAEFWWGKSPSSEIRKHGYFYPSCKSKCLPILTHMLVGLNVEPNPLLDNPAKVTNLEIVYEDEYLIVINKPYDFLSVPGKNIEDSVYSRIKILYPEISEIMTVHRLDMSTSGLMLIAKSKEAHKQLQLSFLHKTIQKRYVAILDGNVELDSGWIDLPLRSDYENRPRQLVCFEQGKPSLTKFEVVERKNGYTRIHFYPITGRTHQLRMHASHEKGLNIPILGDDLYGKRADRLYLHAEGLSFNHPITGVRIELEAKANF